MISSDGQRFGHWGLFDVELSPKLYCWGLISQEVCGGGGGRLCPTLRCHLQNDSSLKMVSDVKLSHFNVSLIVRGKFAISHMNHNFGRRGRAAASNRGPSASRPSA